MTPKAFVGNFQKELGAHRNPEKAASMAAYMKNLFPFLGLPQPELKRLSAPLLKEVKPFVNTKFLHDSVLLLWKFPEREYQYVAIDLLYNHTKQTEEKTLELIKTLITQKSWWDTVDSLATLVGKLVWQFPEWTQTLGSYSSHDNFWLRRTALLYQLNYKDKTDQKRLFHYCLNSASEEEFFIRKAIGWALREYAKSNPQAVRRFLAKHEDKLSSLTIREASKYL
jgi:3-methyladenine DNA glycosylase AlkD